MSPGTPSTESRSKTTGSANLAIGANAGQNLTTGSDNVYIANAGKASEAGTIRIGNSNKQTAIYVAGISETAIGGAAQPVLIKPNGQLGVAPVAASTPLSVADGRRLMAEIERLRAKVRRLGG